MSKNIIFWLEYPLFHVAPLIKNLSFHEDTNVIVIAEFDIPQWRLDIGFYKPDFGLAKEYFCPSKETREQLVSKFSTCQNYHVFHGLIHVKENFKSFKALIKKAAYVGLYFESQQLTGSLKARLRRIYYRLLISRYGKRIDFMLTLGALGAEQYIALGLPAKKVFTFEYHFDKPNIEDFSKSNNNKLTFLYAGRLIKIKNIALILNAIDLIVKQGYIDFEFLIIGDGIERDSLAKLVFDYQLDNVVRFSRSVPNDELKDYYLSADAFILASKFEGWGAVATEAMAFGLPLIISDGCASSCIVKEDYHGFVFENNSVESLKSKLISFIENSNQLVDKSARTMRTKYAEKYLSGDAGCKKLLNILNNISN